jgi:hypothetical protein
VVWDHYLGFFLGYIVYSLKLETLAEVDLQFWVARVPRTPPIKVVPPLFAGAGRFLINFRQSRIRVLISYLRKVESVVIIGLALVLLRKKKNDWFGSLKV